MLLDIQNLCVRYGRIRAVEDLSLTVNEGEIVTVLGANGAGKSSLLKSILGVESATTGLILLDGEDITRAATPTRVGAGISLVPEGRRILITQTIEENLLLGATARSDADDLSADMEDVFQRFPNLKARRSMAASCLSGGEQQMLAIGRALLAKPRLLMLDEPSLGLSPRIVDEIFELFTDLSRNGLSILLVEQNTGMALSVAERGYVLERGAVVMAGTPQELSADDRLTEAYLGGNGSAAA